jgi:hypothetical protein
MCLINWILFLSLSATDYVIQFLFKGHQPTHDDHAKTTDDIEKRFFVFNCQLKKFNGEFFPFF